MEDGAEARGGEAPTWAKLDLCRVLQAWQGVEISDGFSVGCDLVQLGLGMSF